MKTLKQYSQENDISYIKAYRAFQKGEIANARKTDLGIIIEDAHKVINQTIDNSNNMATAGILPVSTDLFTGTKLSTASSRSNISAITETFDRFANIKNGAVPFISSKYGQNSLISLNEPIVLCQKAYYNFAIFRNIIDLMTEYAVTKIYFTGGNKKSRDFFESYFNYINIHSFQTKFYKELFRSCNVFIYRLEIALKQEDINKLVSTFGLTAKAASKYIIPGRYIIMNPADMLVGGAASFITPLYYKLLTAYEVERLRNPVTEDDKKIFEGLSKEEKAQVSKTGYTTIYVKLDHDKLRYVSFHKQDYEPFAMPFGYTVLDDINRKEEMKKMDAQICRTMQHVVLLIKTGYQGKDGQYNVNQAQVLTLQKMFENPSVARVLVTDFTTEADFIIPKIGDILDPKKYEILDKDIAMGLNNIISGGLSSEKFANKSVSVEIFIERLRQAREIFKNEFLVPEIKRISEELGFQSFPEPNFEEIKMSNESDINRIYTQLAQIGILTPSETIDAIKTGRLPNNEESVEHQTEYKKQRDDGLYEPLIGGQKDDGTMIAGKGRPAGTSSPQFKKKISPIGAQNYSLKGLTGNLKITSELETNIHKHLLNKYKIDKLNEEQLSIATELLKIIICNEDKVNWKKSIGKYIESPFDTNKERVSEIQDIALEHQIDMHVAALLYWSKK